MKKKSKKRVRPVGTAPIWTEDLADVIDACCVRMKIEILRRIKGSPPKGKPSDVIGYIRALRVMNEAHPTWPRHVVFGEDDVSKWRKWIEAHLEDGKRGIAEPYRQEFCDAVHSDLDFLEEFVNRKRDKKHDIR